MKISLRQDAEHRNPKVDLGWSLFSSGVCWHLPVPSAIIKKTSVFPHLLALCLRHPFAIGHEIPRCHLHTPWGCWESPSPLKCFMLADSASCLSTLRGEKTLRQSTGGNITGHHFVNAAIRDVYYLHTNNKYQIFHFQAALICVENLPPMIENL